jgi:hypothetical protein
MGWVVGMMRRLQQSVDIISPTSVRELMINRSLHVHGRISRCQQASIISVFDEHLSHKGHVWESQTWLLLPLMCNLLPTFPHLKFPLHHTLTNEKCPV